MAIKENFGFKFSHVPHFEFVQMFEKIWWLTLADQNFEKYSFLKIQMNRRKWLKGHSDDIRLFLDTTKLTF